MPKAILVRKILLVENDPAAANAIQVALAESGTGPLHVEWVRQLSEGVARLSEKGIAAVLLNLSLPDSQGIETFETLHSAARDIPILVLGGDDDEVLAKQAVEQGAQDFLLSGHLNTYLLPRALRNSIERKVVEEALFIEKECRQITLDSVGDAVLFTDSSGRVTSLNLAAESMTGWSRDEAFGRPLAEIFKVIEGTTRLPVQDPVKAALARNRMAKLNGNCILVRRDGFESAVEDSATPIHDRAGNVTGAVIIFHDVSAARDMSLKMIHAAHHDFLTDLPNRMLLNERISQSISLARRQNKHIAVIFLDLDNFKCMNDSLGHAVGDKLLQSVAKRLSGCVRGSDTVSRQGGDEFVILLREITCPEDAAASAEKLHVSLGAPHFIEGHDLQINGSIGISMYPEDGEDAET